ncbi:uncharacterized protein MONBRDRAFT_31826 [Monosiga brevicollis MX1]|uniref:Antistasin-like domain-containing protein n=1 Tax=Monosiga brevicollis TaxID=81824 RepID=A9UVL9_MONBE|nr:uncharacterized protein MONBRDRAFT_31826 [Monosiga brevicollis MX1]EDQ90607.1 predicted protein [Monosiga brevicollis MX1]|eukprot:XP_001744658.1 hypothetical protein [Monosiga brevicollis MX1]
MSPVALRRPLRLLAAVLLAVMFSAAQAQDCNIHQVCGQAVCISADKPPVADCEMDAAQQTERAQVTALNENVHCTAVQEQCSFVCGGIAGFECPADLVCDMGGRDDDCDDCFGVCTRPIEKRKPCLDERDRFYKRFEAPSGTRECRSDDECIVSGCSSEVCAAQAYATTCEALPWVPNGECGCVNNECIWHSCSPCRDMRDCDLKCPFGFVTDDNDCPVCRCREAPCCDPLKEPGQFGNPLVKFRHACCPTTGTWMESDREGVFDCPEFPQGPFGRACPLLALCNLSVPQDSADFANLEGLELNQACDSDKDCVATGCNNQACAAEEDADFCPYTLEPPADSSCQCRYGTCSWVHDCEQPICPPVSCRLHCEHGFQVDENGCEICACVSAWVGCPEEKRCLQGDVIDPSNPSNLLCCDDDEMCVMDPACPLCGGRCVPIDVCYDEDHPYYERFEAPSADNKCETAADCVVSGCSGEVCAAEDVATTCELLDFRPAGACSCVDNQCVWNGRCDADPPCPREQICTSPDGVESCCDEGERCVRGQCLKPQDPCDLPANCTSWFDGCNTCSVSADGCIEYCTKRFCLEYQEPRCLCYDCEDLLCPAIPDDCAAVSRPKYDDCGCMIKCPECIAKKEQCCNPLLEPGKFGNPMGFEGYACCPTTGEWVFSIGDGKTFPCPGQEQGPFGDACKLPKKCRDEEKALKSEVKAALKEEAPRCRVDSDCKAGLQCVPVKNERMGVCLPFYYRRVDIKSCLASNPEPHLLLPRYDLSSPASQLRKRDEKVMYLLIPSCSRQAVQGSSFGR